ncbi:MAG: murein biosynthesis integral membrane protein MurJ, partial [Acidobacteria bacterium]|nr:murein biosynthesis integral membrane protein MurJ [Acidobacteriota bacterium]
MIASAPTEPAAPAGSASGPPDAASSTARLARSAGVIGTATLTSRVLGLVRDQVLAWLFGAGNAMDAFYVAYRIPNLLRDLFAEGAMSAAFVPTFTRRLKQQGKAAAWQLGNQLINALLVATGALVVLGAIYAGPLTGLIAGDYAAVPGKLELTATLTRILLPLLSLVAVAAALMGMLNSLNRFFIPALSPAMFNVGVILSAFVLVPFAPAR